MGWRPGTENQRKVKDSLRVLHLPVNIASIPSHTVRGLRHIGVNARGLMFVNTPLQSDDALTVIELPPFRKPFLWVWRNFQWLYHYLKGIAWADVIHWYFGNPALPWGFDLKYLKALNKPGVVEWLGSDIRIPEIEFKDNPYYATAFHNGYEYQGESLQRSRYVQKRFAETGLVSIASMGMLTYIQSDITHQVYTMAQRIVLSDYPPTYPEPDVKQPIIVHSPSAPIAKGTPTVIKVINELKKKYIFDFRLIQGISRHEALQQIQQADIFLDQFIVGDHGMAALEAMAFGKPVLCYIKPSMIDKYSSDFPVVNANQVNLGQVLESLLKDGHLRNEIGKRSRAYVEKHHDAFQLAYRLLDIYQELIEKKRR
jgi:glycosyltransferase involved in cell wall biosynthesis